MKYGFNFLDGPFYAVILKSKTFFEIMHLVPLGWRQLDHSHCKIRCTIFFLNVFPNLFWLNETGPNSGAINPMFTFYISSFRPKDCSRQIKNPYLKHWRKDRPKINEKKRSKTRRGLVFFCFFLFFLFFFFGSMVLSTSLLKRKLIYTLSYSVLFGIITEKSKNRD